MRLFNRQYTGRLAFDPDTEFHVSVNGKRVVTDDGGLTWRYATRKDASHNERYQKTAVVVNATTERDIHHEEPADNDAHREGLITHSDAHGAKATGHTEAWS